MQKNEITMEIKSSNPVDFKTKKEALQKIARLDIDSLEKLGQLAASGKAVDQLKNNWPLIQSMVM